MSPQYNAKRGGCNKTAGLEQLAGQMWRTNRKMLCGASTSKVLLLILQVSTSSYSPDIPTKETFLTSLHHSTLPQSILIILKAKVRKQGRGVIIYTEHYGCVRLGCTSLVRDGVLSEEKKGNHWGLGQLCSWKNLAVFQVELEKKIWSSM